MQQNHSVICGGSGAESKQQREHQRKAGLVAGFPANSLVAPAVVVPYQHSVFNEVESEYTQAPKGKCQFTEWNGPGSERYFLIYSLVQCHPVSA
jgi:hypothetical protein